MSDLTDLQGMEWDVDGGYWYSVANGNVTPEMLLRHAIKLDTENVELEQLTEAQERLLDTFRRKLDEYEQETMPTLKWENERITAEALAAQNWVRQAKTILGLAGDAFDALLKADHE